MTYKEITEIMEGQIEKAAIEILKNSLDREELVIVEEWINTLNLLSCWGGHEGGHPTIINLVEEG